MALFDWLTGLFTGPVTPEAPPSIEPVDINPATGLPMTGGTFSRLWWVNHCHHTRVIEETDMRISEANAKAIEAATGLRFEIVRTCRFAIALIGLQAVAIAGALFLILR